MFCFNIKQIIFCMSYLGKQIKIHTHQPMQTSIKIIKFHRFEKKSYESNLLVWQTLLIKRKTNFFKEKNSHLLAQVLKSPHVSYRQASTKFTVHQPAHASSLYTHSYIAGNKWFLHPTTYNRNKPTYPMK